MICINYRITLGGNFSITLTFPESAFAPSLPVAFSKNVTDICHFSLLNLTYHPLLALPLINSSIDFSYIKLLPTHIFTYIAPTFLSELESLTLEDISGPCKDRNNIFQKDLQNSQACRCHGCPQLAGITSYN